MSEELKELIEEKHKILHEICELEFEEKGYSKKLKEKNISYNIIRCTPLHKNKYCIGLKRDHFDYIVETNILLIISLTNSKEVDKHIYYVFSPEEDSHFKSGCKGYFDYIEFCRVINGKKHYLRKIEEYLDEKEKEKTSS